MRIEEVGGATLINGDCREVMAAMPENSVDSIVCDPPYGLSFMGKGWDHGVPGQEFWAEALRVAKPGAYLLAFGGTRTHHRLMVAIEDAGWEIRDCVMWVYGSGFPKSLDVSKAIDKAAGAEREVTGRSGRHIAKGEAASSNLYAQDEWTHKNSRMGEFLSAPATAAAKQWQGWGTALKPAWEPIVMARKPLVGTVAANVQQYGTGGLNIDGCRIGNGDDRISGGASGTSAIWNTEADHKRLDRPDGGRWPANLIHDGSEGVVACFPESKGQLAPSIEDGAPQGNNIYSAMNRGGPHHMPRVEQDKSAARFFYCAKASKSDRDDGNTHPTVKPTALMRYLCRLVTPPGGVVLDPFMGSGSTGKAALLEGFRFVGIELDEEHGYFDIALARITHVA